MKTKSSKHVVYINCLKCQNKKKRAVYTTCSELVCFMFWTGKSMNHLLSYCGLVDPRICASDKDLPALLLVYVLDIDLWMAQKQYHKFFPHNFQEKQLRLPTWIELDLSSLVVFTSISILILEVFGSRHPLLGSSNFKQQLFSQQSHDSLEILNIWWGFFYC